MINRSNRTQYLQKIHLSSTSITSCIHVTYKANCTLIVTLINVVYTIILEEGHSFKVWWNLYENVVHGKIYFTTKYSLCNIEHRFGLLIFNGLSDINQDCDQYYIWRYKARRLKSWWNQIINVIFHYGNVRKVLWLEYTDMIYQYKQSSLMGHIY